MIDAVEKIRDSFAPLLTFEFVYRRNHAAMVSYAISALIVCGCFLFGQWPVENEGVLHSWGDRFFCMILTYMALLVTLLSTAHAALSIAGEKEKQTLTLLRMSGLTPREIIFSKAAVSTGFIGFILLPVLPLALACPLLGGVSYYTVCRGFAILAAMAFFFISGGVFISILFKKNYICISFAAAFLLFVHFGFYVIDELINYRTNVYYNTWSATKYFSVLSPMEMWNDFFESINMPLAYNYNHHAKDYFLQLGCGDCAALYFVAGVLTFLASVRIFERYLKWREA